MLGDNVFQNTKILRLFLFVFLFSHFTEAKMASFGDSENKCESTKKAMHVLYKDLRLENRQLELKRQNILEIKNYIKKLDFYYSKLLKKRNRRKLKRKIASTQYQKKRMQKTSAVYTKDYYKHHAKSQKIVDLINALGMRSRMICAN